MNYKVKPLDPDTTGQPTAAAGAPKPAADREPPPVDRPEPGGAPAPLLTPGGGAGIPNPLQRGGGAKKWAGRAGIGDRNAIIGEKRKKRTMRRLV